MLYNDVWILKEFGAAQLYLSTDEWAVSCSDANTKKNMYIVVYKNVPLLFFE